MSDDTLFEDEFDSAETGDDIFQPEANRIRITAPVAARPKQVTITLDVPSVLKELMYHFKASDLEHLSRSLAEIVSVYGKHGLLETTSPPWKDQPEEKPQDKPKSHAPKPSRELPYRFTEEEIVNFVELNNAGVSFEEIAKNSGRSVLGVKRAVQRHRDRSAVKGSEG